MTDICEQLHRLFNGLRRFRFPFDAAAIPLNGIYILFESGELAHGGDRIVRVGTHTGQDQLRSRLTEHFIRENKDRSIFRKNIGRALLAKSADPSASDWDLDLTASLAKQKHGHLIDRERRREIEKEVSRCIQANFSFSVFEFRDKAQRMVMESRIISTLSLCPSCNPSPTWLGLSSPKAKIRESGLWLVNELYKECLSVKGVGQLEQMLARS